MRQSNARMHAYFDRCIKDLRFCDDPEERKMIDYAYESIPYLQYLLEFKTYHLKVPRASGKTTYIKRVAKDISNSWIIAMNEENSRMYRKEGYVNVANVLNVMPFERGVRSSEFGQASCLFFDESVKSRYILEKYLAKYFSIRSIYYNNPKPKDFFVFALYT